MKRTGATGFRSPLAPNRRQQDGRKLKLLCDECEGRFSRLETKFANGLFWPHAGDSVEKFEYDGSLYRFAVSLFWRRLVIDPGVRSHMVRQTCDELEPALRKYLLGNTTAPLGERVYMVTMRETPGFMPVRFWNSYLARTSDMCVAHDDSGKLAFVFAKLGPFQFYLDRSGQFERLIPSGEVREVGGSHRIKWSTDRPPLRFLIDRARNSRGLMEAGLSPSQKAKLKEVTKDSLSNNPDSAHSRILAMDLATEPEPLPGSGPPSRNEPCFCGSGRKYKRCHGRPK